MQRWLKEKINKDKQPKCQQIELYLKQFQIEGKLSNSSTSEDWSEHEAFAKSFNLVQFYALRTTLESYHNCTIFSHVVQEKYADHMITDATHMAITFLFTLLFQQILSEYQIIILLTL